MGRSRGGGLGGLVKPKAKVVGQFSPGRLLNSRRRLYVRSALHGFFQGCFALSSFYRSSPRTRLRPSPLERLREMNMSYRLLASGAFVGALTLLGYAGQADATTRLMLNGAPSLTILAQDEENEEVQESARASNG